MNKPGPFPWSGEVKYRRPNRAFGTLYGAEFPFLRTRPQFGGPPPTWSNPMQKWLAHAVDYVSRWMEFQMRMSEQPGCVIAIAHKKARARNSSGCLSKVATHTIDPYV
jgi:hypothetical protein